MDTYGQTLDRYGTLATRAKVDPADVVYDARNPELLAAREQRKDLVRAAKIATPQELLGMDIDTLQLLDPENMKKPSRDAYNARIIQLQQQSMPQPPAAPAAILPPGVVSPSTMPLGTSSFMRQRYPSKPGIRRDDQFTGY
jgi:hypothetical protein